MSDKLEEHVVYWEALAGLVGRGEDILRALVKAGKKAGGRLREVSLALRDDVRAGKNLSEAMERHGAVFSRGVRMMVRAGEAGAVLQIIMERICKGLNDGSFPLPGTKKEKETTPAAVARFFRGFGWLLSSGVPIVQAFEILSEEAATAGLGDAAQAIRRAILEGRSVAEAMRGAPDVFAEPVCAAVGQGEQEGYLDKAAFEVADALDAGNLASLPSPAARAPGEPEDIVKSHNAAPVVKLVNLVILEAIRSRATDIHIDPTKDGRGRVRLRADGALQALDPFPEGLYGAIVSRIKIMSAMDVVERRRPQDGRIDLNVSGSCYRLFVNVLPTAHGESAAIHIVAAERGVLGLDQIGFAGDQLEGVRALCRLDCGVVIVAGPTGSGSTTLLLAMLEEIDRERKSVLTVEDPVEVPIENVEHVQIKPRVGVTFPLAFRAILRHDPDVIMVGELRDLETAESALRASLTGHLIFTALHTASPPQTVKRLIDIGIEPFQINSAVAAVISQRLVRKLCPECRAEAEVSEERMPKEAVEFIRSGGGAKVYAPKGCDACRGGYRGRTAIHEILIPDDGFRRAVTRSADATSLRKAALASGMKPMFVRGLELAAEGVTSVEEVCRVAWELR